MQNIDYMSPRTDRLASSESVCVRKVHGKCKCKTQSGQGSQRDFASALFAFTNQPAGFWKDFPESESEETVAKYHALNLSDPRKVEHIEWLSGRLR